MNVSNHDNNLHIYVKDNFINLVSTFFSLLDIEYFNQENNFKLLNFTAISFKDFRFLFKKLSLDNQIDIMYKMVKDLYIQTVYLDTIDKSFLQIDLDHFYILKKNQDYFFMYCDFDNLYLQKNNYIQISKIFLLKDYYDNSIVELKEIPSFLHKSVFYTANCKIVLLLEKNINFMDVNQFLHDISYLKNHVLFNFFKNIVCYPNEFKTFYLIY